MVTTASDVYYDPYDVDIHADPYPVFRRLREEAPLYYNEAYDFYALSRFDDVERGFVDHDTFSSAHGGVLEAIKAEFEAPKGVFIMEDPPFHSAHRGRAVPGLHPQEDERPGAPDPPVLRRGPRSAASAATASTSWPISAPRCRCGSSGCCSAFPRRTRRPIRERATSGCVASPASRSATATAVHGRRVLRRVHRLAGEHPADDLMTELLNVEFEDETGTVRRLTRDEILTFVNVLASAGNETTNRLIGWTGKVLGDHPDQRRELVEDRSLIPNAIEEILRFEPPSIHGARYVTRDVEFYGQTVPAGSAIMLLAARPTATTGPSRPTATSSTSTARSATTSPSATASTSAWARPWPGWRAASPSTRCSTGSPTGRSTSTTPSSTPRSSAAGRPSRPPFVDRRPGVVLMAFAAPRLGTASVVTVETADLFSGL